MASQQKVILVAINDDGSSDDNTVCSADGRPFSFGRFAVRVKDVARARTAVAAVFGLMLVVIVACGFTTSARLALRGASNTVTKQYEATELGRVPMPNHSAVGENASVSLSDAGNATNGSAPCGRSCMVSGFSVPKNACSEGQHDCTLSKCCARAGMQCFSKNSTFARCQPSCSGAPDLTDPEGGRWSCERLGERAVGSAVPCSAPGEDCRSSGCCAVAGTRCFEKNAWYASCKAECSPGESDQSDEEGSPWGCKALGDFAPGAASWVKSSCSKSYEDCTETRCCADAGMTCFAENDWYARCVPSCESSSCKALSEKTPEQQSELHRGVLMPASGTVAKWVENCSAKGEDCNQTRCCKQPGHACFQGDHNRSVCMDEAKADDTVHKIGLRSFGMARKGWPSLYCWSMVAFGTQETVLVGAQTKSSVGIFACDGHAVVSDGPVDIKNTVVLVVKSMPVGVSSEGTAANTRQFIEAWNAVLKQGDFEYHDWTLKVDPDAVVLPDRIRDHLRPATLTGNGEDMQYVANCNAYPNTPGFPMMYGSLEVVSRKAMVHFGKNAKEKCVDGLPWKNWGEDVFLVACMHVLNISRTDDFSLIGDNLCIGNGHVGADCTNRALASFHPFKDLWSWTSCFELATGVSLQVDAAFRKEKRKR